MNHFDMKLIETSPDWSECDTGFTERVMDDVRKSRDIFSSQIRRTSIISNERTLFMKLRHLPKVALISLALAGLLLVSGTAYAAYQLWPQLNGHTTPPKIDSSGRQTTSVLGNCADALSGKTYELKKGAPITKDEMGSVITAQCQVNAFTNWAMKKSGEKIKKFGDNPLNGSIRQEVMPASLATHIENITPHYVTFAALSKYQQPTSKAVVDAKTLYVIKDQLAKAQDFKAGDPIVYVLGQTVKYTNLPGCTSDHCSSSGDVISQRVIAIMKLDLPFASYDQFAWQSLIEIVPCRGNPTDLCRQGFSGGIMMYDNSDKLSKEQRPSDELRDIEGTLVRFDDHTFTIKTMSDHIFTINETSDLLTDFNTHQAANYNTRIAVGDTLSLTYYQSKLNASRSISQENISSLTLSLEMVGKADAIQKF